MKAYIEALSRDPSGALINKALEEANRVFKDPGVRPNAKKVLVIITDRRSGVSLDDIRTAAKPLSDGGIDVIPVAIGNEVRKNELEPCTTDEENVIAVPTTESPQSLADKIMEKSLKRMFLLVFICSIYSSTNCSGASLYLFCLLSLAHNRVSQLLLGPRQRY